ncbi:50S ribosomal protein L5 [Candidatus Woesearchaeota archaeon]|nr:50S ribosomal protein L5 [Candidatus Woesearchaeota archaeon]
MNKMQEIRIEKITLNIGIGESGDRLEKAVLLLKYISGIKPVKTKTMQRIPTWNIRPKLAIGAKVTLRGKKAEALLKKLFEAGRNKIAMKKFDRNGNISFGIKEYINIPEIEYKPEIGIIGLEVAVTLERPGFRIKKRRLKKSKVGIKHRITKEQAMEFIKSKFNIKITEKEEEDDY